MKRTKTSLVLAALSFVTAGSAHAQVRLDWSRTFGTALGDQATATAVDASGIVYVAGISNAASGLLAGTAFVAAWDIAGNQLWSATFDSTLGRAEYPSAIAPDGSGGIYVAGAALGVMSQNYAGFLLHFDASGALTWSREQPTTSNGSFSPTLLVDGLGRAIVGGRVPSITGTGPADAAITAYTQGGAVAWQSTTASAQGGIDTIVDLVLHPSGDIVGVGTLDSGGSPIPLLIRVTSSGALVQAQEIVTQDVTLGFAVGVEIAPDGRTFVAAAGLPPGAPVYALVLFAFDPQWQLLWSRSITGPLQGGSGGGAAATDLVLDPFGRAVVLGQRAQGNAGRALVVVAYEANGDTAWQHIVNDVFGGTATNLWNLTDDLLVDPSGEVIAIGSHGPALADTVSDAFAFTVDSAGAKRFAHRYGFPPTTGGSFDVGTAGALAGPQSFVIVGRAQTSAASTGFDAFVARFTRTASGFCHGDDVGAACPCGNASAPVERAGCASSRGVGGRLADLGASSLANDTLALVGTSMPNTLTLYFQGTTALAGSVFGDGLMCAGGSIIRLGAARNPGGTSQYPEAGDLPISVQGQISAPGERTYQALYRNAATFCTGDSFNLTNGVRVTWEP